MAGSGEMNGHALIFGTLWIGAASIGICEQNKLTVGVYSYAEVAEDELEHAEREAAEIFGRAGIHVPWVACPVTHEDFEKLRDCNQALAGSTLYLNVLPESMVARAGRPPKLMGVGLEDHASVLSDRVQKIADDKGISPRVVFRLGHGSRARPPATRPGASGHRHHGQRFAARTAPTSRARGTAGVLYRAGSTHARLDAT
jgi:hypothetical protein